MSEDNMCPNCVTPSRCNGPHDLEAWTLRTDTTHLTAPAPADQTRADVVLTEAERDSVCVCPWTNTGVCPGDAHEVRCSRQRLVVERIIADRLAARDAEHAAEVEVLRRERDHYRGGWRVAFDAGIGNQDRAKAAEATVERVRALAKGPTSSGYRPYAITLGDDVHMAVLLDDLRAALDGER